MNKNKIIFLMIVLFCQSPGYSQITKGNWMVGGNGSFTSTKIDYGSLGVNASTSLLRISPNIGYFIVDKFSLGLKIDILHDRSSSSNSITSYQLGPFLRYYLLPADNQLNIFAEADFQIGASRYNIPSKIFTFQAGPVFYLTSNVGLEFTVGYIKSFATETATTNSIQVGLGLQVHLERNN